KSANLSTPTTIGAAWVPNFLLRQRRPDRLQLVRLDDVALLEVVEVLQADAALEALVDFLHVVLETAQRGDAAGEDRLRVAQQPYERGQRDLPDAGVDDVHRHFGSGEPGERVLQRLDGSLHVRLDDDLEDLRLVLLALGEQVLERELLGPRDEVLLARLGPAVLGDGGCRV